MPKWTKEFDPDSGLYYYYNTEDGSSSWDVPPDFTEREEKRESSTTTTTPTTTKNNTSPQRFGNKSNKKSKKISWTEAYIREGSKPWECILCKKVNPSMQLTCKQCGKRKPKRTSLEEVAALKIQCSHRQFRARCRISNKVLKTYDKVWDNKLKAYVYRNKLNQATSSSKPRFMQVDDVPLSKIQLNLAKQRAERKSAEEERQAKWEIEKRREKKHAEDAVVREWDNLWAVYFREANKTNQLIFCWKNVDRFHASIFEMKNLTCVRLIGNKLTELPTQLFEILTKLKKLSFSNNLLTYLPPSIGSLKHLMELNLLKNRLVELPPEFCNLKKLETLELSGNNLSKLPERFGALKKLRGTLAIENNCLTKLPESFGLLQITSLRLTMNRLTSLPNSMKMMGLLQSVVANINALDDFPLPLTHLSELTHLSLCKNDIGRVPSQVGRMTSLKNLWLDWNRVEELPTEVSDLIHLKSFSVNGNPMRSPTMEIISQGTDVIRSWCSKRAVFNTHRKRVNVIKSLQRLFAAIIEVGNADPDLIAYFDAEAHEKETKSASTGTWKDEMGGGFYSFANDVLFKEIIPRLQRVAGRLPRTDGKLQRAAAFEWEPEEVEEALAHCEDSCGPVAHTGLKLMFRKCRCKKNGKRRVCVPPRKGYLCKRANAALIKKRFTTGAEYREELSNQQEMEKIQLAKSIAKNVAMEYCNSEDGAKDMAARALKQSADALYQDQKRVYIEKMTVTQTKRFDHDCAQRDKMMAALQKHRQIRIDEIKEEMDELRGKLEHLRGWEAKKCEEKYEAAERALQNIPEDDEIELLQEQMDEAPLLHENEMLGIKDGEGFEQKRSRQKLTSKQKKFAKSIRQKVEDQYSAAYELEAKKVAQTEFRLMRKIGASWTRGALRRIFHKWSAYTKDVIENRLILLAFEGEALRTEAMGKENEEKLKAMEMLKWVESWDPYTERKFFEHSETKEIVWDEMPTDRQFVLRR